MQPKSLQWNKSFDKIHSTPDCWVKTIANSWSFKIKAYLIVSRVIPKFFQNFVVRGCDVLVTSVHDAIIELSLLNVQKTNNKRQRAVLFGHIRHCHGNAARCTSPATCRKSITIFCIVYKDKPRKKYEIRYSDQKLLGTGITPIYQAPTTTSPKK